MNQEINLFSEQEECSLQQETNLLIPPQIETLSSKKQIKRIIEAVLFSSSEPVPFSTLHELTSTIAQLKPRFIKEIIEELRTDYSNNSFELKELDTGYLLQTRKEFSEYIENIKALKRPERLSHAATEVLAIIAYKSPITKGKINSIRGVDSAGTIQNLIDRELIEAVGKMESPGRPTLYSTTPRFLNHFGLNSIEELPTPSK
jgi:segregation and condensation protein B